MKLITEVTEDVKLITEANKAGGEDYFIEGIFLQGNLKNRNGRVYPSHILNKQVESYIKEYVDRNRAFGELGHPENPSINMERVSHIITELKLDGDNWIGKAKIINEGMGRIARGILAAGGQLGVSSRALGSLVQREGFNEVQDDLHLVTAADIVADPSAPEAFVKGIMEGKEWVCEGGIFKEITPSVEKINIDVKTKVEEVIRKTKYDRTLRESMLIDAFYQYLEKISKEDI